ncbi:hypothetical protein N7474_003396 [Penicillium riverlandense]|uniref:uncharacterized protein n=1 Tax=Penicillium riverlandense TaxID=1903569 RepID=UPI0025483824|nr:uncharacterized protein N7474_003396 [Penicillium riverlandense]KAJ5826258.1 hypothetical protein N7474_003396 [Penicillium riverlandense]
MPPPPIPQFLLPRGLPSTRVLRTLHQRQQQGILNTPSSRAFTSTRHTFAKSKNQEHDKSRTLGQPDKFRPPSHPQRRVVNPSSRSGQPINYGPRLTAEEREAQNKKQYPNMFPPEGTVMFKFLTNRWIHIWIAMGTLTALATFTFTTNFKANSPFAHLLPPWSNLLPHPIDTLSQAFSVYRMHVQHESMRVREQRHRRIDDAEKRRQYRVAHGLEEPTEKDGEGALKDDQSPIATEKSSAEYVDWEGNKKPAKKWLGIW